MDVEKFFELPKMTIEERIEWRASLTKQQAELLRFCWRLYLTIDPNSYPNAVFRMDPRRKGPL